jgi:hypothetical protein
MGTTSYWHDCGPHVQDYWATTVPSPASAPYSDVSFQITPASPVEERRRDRLATKSNKGLHSVFAAIRSKSNDPPSGRQRRQHRHSTTSIDTSSLEASYSPRSSLQAPYQSSPRKPEVRPDLSALVPDYLDDPPPYSSPVREREEVIEEVIDWKAHFDRTPILTRTSYLHSSPTMQDMLSPGASVGGAWDRIARRLSR